MQRKPLLSTINQTQYGDNILMQSYKKKISNEFWHAEQTMITIYFFVETGWPVFKFNPFLNSFNTVRWSLEANVYHWLWASIDGKTPFSSLM